MEIYFFETGLRRDGMQPAPAVQFHPGVDMYETEGALKVKIELPGIEPDRVGITLAADDRTLTIAGERREQHEEQHDRIRCYHLEIFYGTFLREITLPANVRIDRDRLSASYRNGFLVITLPKRAETQAETRQIEITSE
jgi:HSP20 family protein